MLSRGTLKMLKWGWLRIKVCETAASNNLLISSGDYTEITCDSPVTGQHIVVFTNPGQYLEVCELEAFSGKHVKVCTKVDNICLFVFTQYGCTINALLN